MMNDYDSVDDTNYVYMCVCVCVCGRNEARKWRKAKTEKEFQFNTVISVICFNTI